MNSHNHPGRCRMRWIKLRFRTKMIVFMCLTTIGLSLFIGYFSIRKYQSVMEKEISESVMQAFIQSNTLLDYNIREYERLLSLVSSHSEIQKILASSFEDQYDWFIKEGNLNSATRAISATHSETPTIQYYLLHPQQIFISSAYTTPPLPGDTLNGILGSDGIGYAWINTVPSGTADPAGSDSADPESAGSQLTVLKLCIDEMTNAKNAVAYIRIDTQSLFRSVEKLNYGNSQISVYMPDHSILFSQTGSNTIVPDLSVYSGRMDNSPNGYFDTVIEGKRYLIIYNRENKNNWTLVGVLPYRSVMNAFTSVRDRILTVTIISTCVCLLLIYLFLYQNTKKITILSSAMEQVNAGALDVSVPLNGHGEIDHMAHIFAAMLQKIKQQLADLDSASKREHKLELLALQEQINPHLLYNTLSTINSYAEEIEAVEITETVRSLITYYNLTLSNGMEFITAADELSHAFSYIKIMQKRFGPQLKASIEADEGIGQFYCPKIILQPFIENSIYHGFSNNNGFSGTITLRAFKSNQCVRFEIQDNGCGMSDEKIRQIMTDPGNSYAIKNIDTRIKLYFGNEYGVTVISRPGEGCLFIITIPALTERNGRI